MKPAPPVTKIVRMPCSAPRWGRHSCLPRREVCPRDVQTPPSRIAQTRSATQRKWTPGIPGQFPKSRGAVVSAAGRKSPDALRAPRTARRCPRTFEWTDLAARLAGLRSPRLGECPLELAEDHAAGAGLQHARDGDFHGAAD